jgi:hypothetical protein
MARTTPGGSVEAGVKCKVLFLLVVLSSGGVYCTPFFLGIGCFARVAPLRKASILNGFGLAARESSGQRPRGSLVSCVCVPAALSEAL